MKAMGKEFLALHFLCQSHGIHLAVCEVIYKKKKGKNKKTTTSGRPRKSRNTSRLSSMEVRAALESSDTAESVESDTADSEVEEHKGKYNNGSIA